MESSRRVARSCEPTESSHIVSRAVLGCAVVEPLGCLLVDGLKLVDQCHGYLQGRVDICVVAHKETQLEGMQSNGHHTKRDELGWSTTGHWVADLHQKSALCVMISTDSGWDLWL